MKKKLLSLLLTMTLLLLLIPSLGVTASAAVDGNAGACYWRLDGTTLYISGSGPIPNYDGTQMAPWFNYYDQIGSVIIYEGVTAIGDFAFAGCMYMTSISLPSSLTAIGDSAFLYCSSLPAITIPKNVTRIGMGIFAVCNNLVTLYADAANPVYQVLGNCVVEKSTRTVVAGTVSSKPQAAHNIKAIGAGAFVMVNGLNMTLPEGVTSIGEGAFYGITGSSYVGLPSTLQELGEMAFYQAEYAPVDFVIPAGVKRIPAYCFAESTVTRVELSKSLEEIGEGAFMYCFQLRTILPSRNQLNGFALGNVKKIGDDAFFGSELLGSLTIPKSVESIGVSAFSAIPDLTDIEVEEGNAYYKAANGCLIEKESGLLISGCSDSRIPDDAGIRTIGAYAFAYADMKDAYVPEGVTRMEEGAFYGSALEHLRLPSTIQYVGVAALSECDWFSALTLHGTVPAFGEDCFLNTPANGAAMTVWYEGTGARPSKNSVPSNYNTYWHYADNACDLFCNDCGTSRRAYILEHRYASACDPSCEECGELRLGAAHTYDNDCDGVCNECGEARAVADHLYDHACDQDCNECGEKRQTEHLYDGPCDGACNTCNATRRAPHVYTDSSDQDCNECGQARPPYVAGDVDDSEEVNSDDAIHLLFHVMFPERYEVTQPADFNHSGAVDADDAIYLLFHVMFPERYQI